MSVFNHSRKNVIMLVFSSMFLVIIIQLANLQIFSSKYKVMADDQGKFRKVIYPDRGIIFDRNHKVLLQNTNSSDLMIIPNKIKGIDTIALCRILEIDTVQFKKRVLDAVIKNGYSRASVFEPLVNDEMMAKLSEALYKFEPGFFLQQRPVRTYPYEAAANVLGYIAEVDTNFLKKHKSEGYIPGDFAGMTGMECSYEKVLMGQRGIQYWKRDNKNRLTEKLDNGKYDTAAIAGQNIHTSIDIELQELGEKLMQNKIGAIVALDPHTGGILAMVSAPTYRPNYLTGSQRKKHFSQLYRDPSLPLLNRSVNATYSPGSTFKTLQGLVGLYEGVITPYTTFGCSGAFYGCGSGKPMKCLDPGTFFLKTAITHSCNTYFANVMQRVINNPKYPDVDSSLHSWDNFMYSFGLGHKLGVDIPTERGANIPTPDDYNKKYGKGHWNFCTFRSVSIGQGEVTTTPIQVANEMAYLANNGWYITPHLVDSIDGGDKFHQLDKYKIKHRPINIPDSVFEAVKDGMLGVVESGTGQRAKIKSVVMCGKTGTVENYYHGVKQKNHSFFAAFAPRDNPKIAIMCVVENSGQGAHYAAPVVSLMIEKYLKDSIVDKPRKDLIETFSKINLMPPRIAIELRRLDSLDHAGDSAYLIRKGFIKLIKDTLDTEAEPEDDSPSFSTTAMGNQTPRKETPVKSTKSDALLPDKKNGKTAKKDSTVI